MDPDYEIMFTWTEDRSLLVHVATEDSLLEYELDTSESRKLFNFLQEKFEPIKKITKVLNNLTDTKTKKDKQ